MLLQAPLWDAARNCRVEAKLQCRFSPSFVAVRPSIAACFMPCRQVRWWAPSGVAGQGWSDSVRTHPNYSAVRPLIAASSFAGVKLQCWFSPSFVAARPRIAACFMPCRQVRWWAPSGVAGLGWSDSVRTHPVCYATWHISLCLCWLASGKRSLYTAML